MIKNPIGYWYIQHQETKKFYCFVQEKWTDDILCVCKRVDRESLDDIIEEELYDENCEVVYVEFSYEVHKVR